MALELTTDGDTGTSTTGETVLEMLGDHTETVLGSCFGWYLAFTRIVTGVDIVVKAGASIDILLGTKIEMQAAAVATIQAAAVVTVQTGSVSTIGGLEELNAKTIVTDRITNHNQFITTGLYVIDALDESGLSRISRYTTEQENGATSVETWSSSKTINATIFSLVSPTSGRVSLNAGTNGLRLDSTGAKINANLIELGE